MKEELLRLFIAINFPDDIKLRLSQLTDELKKNTVRGCFTRKDNFHLTLAFIGETRHKEEVIKAMDYGVEMAETEPFDLNIGGFGRFKGRDGDIFWVGVENNPALSGLYEALKKELKKYEFKVDEKQFKPHLTLGRQVRLKPGYTINDFEKQIPSLTVHTKGISLMKSERIEGRLVYTELYYKNL
ncbi:MAG: RNA 2',3'-cyclic phosphodiesterase [Lachnoclostridium sp.]|jgi:RNA 2',3'-cyclic 3'-phosphodiesterase